MYIIFQIYIYTHTLLAELKIVITSDIKINTFTLIFFTLFKTYIREYGSSIVLQFPTHLFKITVNEI